MLDSFSAAEYNTPVMQLLLPHLRDLAERAYQSGRPVFSDFLSESECAEFYLHQREFSYAQPALWGGAEGCVRKIVRFGKEAPFPVRLVEIAPRQKKFAENFGHRDVLGALLSLGLERSTLGDLALSGGSAYCFCLDRVAPLLCEELTRVRRTDVVCRETDAPFPAAHETQERAVFLSSLRADCVLAAAYGLSRADTLACFREERVLLNGRPCTENAKEIKPGDCLTLRGRGKFTLVTLGGESRKGRLRVTLSFPQ